MKLGVVCLAVALAATPAFADSPRVIDGDTLELGGQRVRLWGIDAPERSQTCEGRDGQTYECGRDATAVLRELTAQAVTCVERDRDRYGRSVAVCSTASGELNAAMVRRGWAVDYTRYSHGAYRAEEAQAKAEGAGLWSGRFTLPEAFRRR